MASRQIGVGDQWEQRALSQRNTTQRPSDVIIVEAEDSSGLIKVQLPNSVSFCHNQFFMLPFSFACLGFFLFLTINCSQHSGEADRKTIMLELRHFLSSPGTFRLHQLRPEILQSLSFVQTSSGLSTLRFTSITNVFNSLDCFNDLLFDINPFSVYGFMNLARKRTGFTFPFNHI